MPAEKIMTEQNRSTGGTEESLEQADEFARMASQSQRIVADFIARADRGEIQLRGLRRRIKAQSNIE